MLKKPIKPNIYKTLKMALRRITQTTLPVAIYLAKNRRSILPLFAAQ